MKTGDLVFIKDVSVKSMEAFKVYGSRHSYLICPCKVPKSQPLVIASMLSISLAMLYYDNDTSKMTIIYVDDLAKAGRKND